MKKDLTDEAILRQWLEGDLSPEELEQLKNHEAFNDYKKIIDATEGLYVPEYDADKLFSKIKERKQFTKKPIKRIAYWLSASAAAILLLFIYFANQTIEYSTGIGEDLVVTLPDNSKVHLNSNSFLEYKKNDWENNRTLKFSGEAYFEVSKGQKFLVETKEGIVEVLGTKFNVIAQSDFFEVLCQEGKVKASNNAGKSGILTQGKGFRSIENQEFILEFNGNRPSWLKGESSFNGTPLTQVIVALQNEFGVVINYKNIDKNQRFTGSFTHENLELALKTVFDAMEISYTFEDDQKIVLYKD